MSKASRFQEKISAEKIETILKNILQFKIKDFMFDPTGFEEQFGKNTDGTLYILNVTGSYQFYSDILAHLIAKLNKRIK